MACPFDWKLPCTQHVTFLTWWYLYWEDLCQLKPNSTMIITACTIMQWDNKKKNKEQVETKSIKRKTQKEKRAWFIREAHKSWLQERPPNTNHNSLRISLCGRDWATFSLFLSLTRNYADKKETCSFIYRVRGLELDRGDKIKAMQMKWLIISRQLGRQNHMMILEWICFFFGKGLDLFQFFFSFLMW